MLVNIDICGDILVQAETDFERDYVRKFEGCSYSAFLKRGLTPAEVIGLKLRKTSDAEELAATTANTARDAIADQYEKWLDETCFSVDGHEAVRHFIKWSQQQHP